MLLYDLRSVTIECMAMSKWRVLLAMVTRQRKSQGMNTRICWKIDPQHILQAYECSTQLPTHPKIFLHPRQSTVRRSLAALKHGTWKTLLGIEIICAFTTIMTTKPQVTSLLQRYSIRSLTPQHEKFSGHLPPIWHLREVSGKHVKPRSHYRRVPSGTITSHLLQF